MPLSNEFSNTRLSYLQDAIKNTKVVAQQFYPRYVREYNEQFPFTEQKLSNINNPSNNSGVVKGYLGNKNLNQIEEDLTTQLTTVTNDETLSREIVRFLEDNLSIGELNYYSEHFNTIQKKISIPYGGISKDLFMDKILMALANDPHKSDLSVYKKVGPANDQESINGSFNGDNNNDEEPWIQTTNDEILIPPSLRHSIALPRKHALKLLNLKEANGDLKHLGLYKKDIEHEEELPSTSELKNFRGRKLGIPNKSNRIHSTEQDYEEKLKDVMFKRLGINADENPVSYDIYKQNYDFVSPESLSYPSLTRENLNSLIVDQSKQFYNNKSYFDVLRMRSDNSSFSEPSRHLDFNSPTPSRRAPPPPLSTIQDTYKQPTPKRVRLKRPPRTTLPISSFSDAGTTLPTETIISSPTQIMARLNDINKQAIKQKKENALKYANKRPTKGSGIAFPPLKLQDRVIKHKKVFNNKYAIDTKKLKKNILDLKYLKNANHVATFQPIEISTYLKNIIENIIKDNYNLKKEEFNHLNETEKRILKRLFHFLKIQNEDVMDYTNDLTNQFQVAYGSFLAGNNNKELIQELKEYVKLAIHENTINKSDGQLILNKLNITK